MSITTFILGESGTGKSTSLRNLNPSETLLIQVINKPLPFKTNQWKRFNKESEPRGNVFCTDQYDEIIRLMQKTQRPIIVVDDFQYMLSNEYLRRNDERSFDKFSDIARNVWEVLMKASQLESHKRVYVLSHTHTDDAGRTKIRTVGKFLDEKLCPEGLVTIVLRSQRVNGQYIFSTQNSGHDTVKSPIDMFSEEHIPNDLAAVDKAITDYYDLTTTA